MSKFEHLVSKLSSEPRLHMRVTSLWGSQECRDYIKELLIDNRDRYHSSVRGFTMEVFLTLDSLLDLHDAVFPQFKPSNTVWDEVHKRTH